MMEIILYIGCYGVIAVRCFTLLTCLVSMMPCGQWKGFLLFSLRML